MAKNTKKSSKSGKSGKDDKDDKDKKTAPEKMKYGVAELAEKLGIKEASVRVRLRNEEVDKAGKSYGWNTEVEFNKVVALLKPKKEKESE